VLVGWVGLFPTLVLLSLTEVAGAVVAWTSPLRRLVGVPATAAV
jgi:hypothetical protein